MITDTIGGFTDADPNCKGCGKPLLLENAWMTDGCPCNTPLGINSMNETRWRLLMQLQQNQSLENERLRKTLAFVPARIAIEAGERAGFGNNVTTKQEAGHGEEKGKEANRVQGV